MYDVSEAIEGIWSRSGALPARLLLSRPSFPLRGGVLGDRRDCPLLALGDRAVDCGLLESIGACGHLADGRIVVVQAEDVVEGGTQLRRHDATFCALLPILTVGEDVDLRDRQSFPREPDDVMVERLCISIIIVIKPPSSASLCETLR